LTLLAEAHVEFGIGGTARRLLLPVSHPGLLLIYLLQPRLSTSTMAAFSTKLGHGLAKILRIDLHYRNETGSERVTRGESVFSVGSADTYVEHEPTSAEWLREVIPNGRDILNYFHNLFPFTHWITRYNVQWLIGDLVAGM
jgi:hypothetical protein